MRIVCCVLVLCCAVARAEEANWPVRLNIAMPLGYTGGTEALHGFTWGFRASASVHPHEHGLGLGAYAEVLLDTETDQLATLGVAADYPVKQLGGIDWRVGGNGGLRTSDHDNDKRSVWGVSSAIALPFYLYELRLGLRFEATVHGGAISAESVLVDVDLVALIGAAAAGAAGK